MGTDNNGYAVSPETIIRPLSKPLCLWYIAHYCWSRKYTVRAAASYCGVSERCVFYWLHGRTSVPEPVQALLTRYMDDMRRPEHDIAPALCSETSASVISLTTLTLARPGISQ